MRYSVFRAIPTVIGGPPLKVPLKIKYQYLKGIFIQISDLMTYSKRESSI
jgi:hypothetical protein